MSTQTINLESPIIRGEKKVDVITLRKPNVIALRGISMRALLDMDVNAVVSVIPRISEPPIIDSEVTQMDPADLMQIGVAIAGFFIPRRFVEENIHSADFLT